MFSTPAPVPIPFPLTSAPGANVANSAGRLVNAYAEPLIEGARGTHVRRRAPGLAAFTAPSLTGWRGAIVVGSQLYAAWTSSGGKVATYNAGGAETVASGTLPGLKLVFWARNDAAIPDVVVVDPDNGAFVVSSAPAVSAYPDVNVGAPNSVCYQDGYFFFTHGDGTVIASGINSTAINALDFVKVDGQIGGLLRGVTYGGQLYLCGTDSIEVYNNTAEPTGFPFSRVTVIPRGLVGRYAVTGWEPGFGRGIIFVGNDRKVYALNGYAPSEISTPDVCRAIGSYFRLGGSADAVSMFPYSVNGHAVIGLRLGNAATWMFDVDRLWWHERTSPSTQLTCWRAYGTVSFNNTWLGGDIGNEAIVRITEDNADELGDNIPFIVESGPVTAFPNRLQVAQSTFDIARGVGMATGSDPAQTDPRCYIQWTDDGGLIWSTPVERKLGRQMTSPTPVRVNRVGQTKDQGRRYRVTVYDPVAVELIGGAMSDNIRNY
jgi:hypothetical protein